MCGAGYNCIGVHAEELGFASCGPSVQRRGTTGSKDSVLRLGCGTAAADTAALYCGLCCGDRWLMQLLHAMDVVPQAPLVPAGRGRTGEGVGGSMEHPGALLYSASPSWPAGASAVQQSARMSWLQQSCTAPPVAPCSAVLCQDECKLFSGSYVCYTFHGQNMPFDPPGGQHWHALLAYTCAATTWHAWRTLWPCVTPYSRATVSAACSPPCAAVQGNQGVQYSSTQRVHPQQTQHASKSHAHRHKLPTLHQSYTHPPSRSNHESPVPS